jgi:hypothetical protein
MRRLSETPLRATSRRSGRRNPTASEARSRPEQRLGRALSRRSLLPLASRRRAHRIPRVRVSEPGRSTHQPRSGGSLRRVGETWEFVAAPANTGSSEQLLYRRPAVLSHPPTGTSTSLAMAGGWGTTSRPRLTSTNEDIPVALERRPYWTLRRVRSDPLHRFGGCFGVDVASDLRSLRLATDPPSLQVLSSHRDSTAAERDDQRSDDHG